VRQATARQAAVTAAAGVRHPNLRFQVEVLRVCNVASTLKFASMDASVFDLQQSLAALGDRRRAVILMHDNPDPDALAAAEGLRVLLAATRSVDSVVAAGGIIGRAENRAMVRALGLGLRRIESLDLREFGIVAMVDTQPETGNNSLPAGHRIDIVVDHHARRSSSLRAPWCDIRPNRGATSAIVYDYLRSLQIPLDRPVATAMLYALKSETRDLGREAGEAERHMFVDLMAQADMELLDRIVNPKVPPAHFVALDRALQAARIHGPLVCTGLHRIEYPDLVAEIADLLLPLDCAHWVLCVGHYRGAVHLSLRSDLADARAGELIQELVRGRGSAGGHGTIAGGRLTAKVANDEELALVYRELVATLCGLLGIDEVHGAPLLTSR
jgi:nanoRNase/pAp phosphatase (c-di-AMP/oligoRNAs hydrolase)